MQGISAEHIDQEWTQARPVFGTAWYIWGIILLFAYGAGVLLLLYITWENSRKKEGECPNCNAKNVLDKSNENSCQACEELLIIRGDRIYLESSDMKECPYCAERIKAAAIVCRYCGRDIGESNPPPKPSHVSKTDPDPELMDRYGIEYDEPSGRYFYGRQGFPDFDSALQYVLNRAAGESKGE